MNEWLADNYLVVTSVTALIVVVIFVAQKIIRDQYHKRRFKKNLFSQYLPPELVDSWMERYPVSERPERVEFSVFAPLDIGSGSKFILDVWAYLPDQYHVIANLAKEVGREALLGRKHGVSVERNTIFSVTVDIDMLDVREPTDTILWEGTPANASYIVNVPSNVPLGRYPGKAVVSYQGIVIAKINFLVSVKNVESRGYTDSSNGVFYPKTAFASYAREDREDVLSRVQGMKKVAPDLDIFVDVFSLRSGENWKDKLVEHVASKNVFYLFWSHFAAESEWVEREWRIALNKRGIAYIDPVPLEEIEAAPPPPELESLHFADAYVAYIQYEKLMKN